MRYKELKSKKLWLTYLSVCELEPVEFCVLVQADSQASRSEFCVSRNEGKGFRHGISIWTSLKLQTDLTEFETQYQNLQIIDN